jgi:hypothetical protein
VQAPKKPVLKKNTGLDIPDVKPRDLNFTLEKRTKSDTTQEKKGESQSAKDIGYIPPIPEFKKKLDKKHSEPTVKPDEPLKEAKSKEDQTGDVQATKRKARKIKLASIASKYPLITT